MNGRIVVLGIVYKANVEITFNLGSILFLVVFEQTVNFV